MGLLAFHTMALDRGHLTSGSALIQKFSPLVSLPNISPTETLFKFIPSPRNMLINTSRHTFIYLFIYLGFT
jgi:hypothetical protein